MTELSSQVRPWIGLIYAPASGGADCLTLPEESKAACPPEVRSNRNTNLVALATHAFKSAAIDFGEDVLVLVRPDQHVACGKQLAGPEDTHGS